MRTSIIFYRTLGALVMLAGLLMAGPAPTAVAQEVLTNDSIMSMVKGGLSEAVVLARIRSGPGNFDTSTNSLLALKKAGVSDKVIEAMVSAPRAGAAAAAAPAPAPAPSPAPAPPAGSAPAPSVSAGARSSAGGAAATLPRDSIYHLNGAKYTEMQPQVVEIETSSAFFSQKSEVVLGGRQAEYRITDKQPQFYSYYAPTEALLVKLKPGDKKNDRNLKMGSGGYHPFGGSSRQGVRSEDRIAVKSEREANGFYRITPAATLPAGEYGFIVLSGTSAGGRMFDFGVD
ncbi:MAG TPA: hypothetical protein VFG27_07445 [Pseudomonadales bacterium]|nr:hypothetical protein [Pseudomonadales bacterium]